MFTEKDIELAGQVVDEMEYFVRINYGWKDPIDRSVLFLCTKVAKLENENKELRAMITGEHEVMT